MVCHLSSRSTPAPISNAMRLYVSMRCEATFQQKAIFKECYVTNRNINPVGLDWMDELNLIQFLDENEICQTPILEPVSAENLVGGCNQCLHCCRDPSSFCSYSIAKIRFSQDSALTYHSGPIRGATHTTVMNSDWKRSDVILLSPTTSRSAISILNELVVYQKRSLRIQVHNLTLHFAKFCFDRSIIQQRRSFAVLVQSAHQQNLEVKIGGQRVKRFCYQNNFETRCARVVLAILSLTLEEPVIRRCSATTRKKRSRYYRPCTTRTRWHFSRLP
ncbi:hypothetical protein ACTXT7_016629, partial [Hymenolepis weldensis]